MTPMMEQYFEVKDKYKDYILFYRLGDFYEMFFEDAQVASRELELTLTGRDCGEEQRAPMCGVPYHSAEGYIGKLISAGYKVAICEQTEDPALAKGLVNREVIRVVTPGTLIESTLLPETRNNYLAALYCDDGSFGICFCDISTAYMTSTVITGADAETLLANELSTYMPREIISNVPFSDIEAVSKWLAEKDGRVLYSQLPDKFTRENSDKAHERFGECDERVLFAAGGALAYIEETQKTDASYIRSMSVYSRSQFLEMDSSTRRNLELCETIVGKDKRGSLLWVLDRTNTAAGARMLRERIEHPVTSIPEILRRQSAVGALAENLMLREELSEKLSSVLDLERLITRVIYKTASARELRAICQTVSVIPDIKRLLCSSDHDELISLGANADELSDVRELIDDTIVDTPPFQVREGGMIKPGYSPELDELRSIVDDSKTYLTEIENAEKEKTGIQKLKIGYNRVFGYYIEIPRSSSENVPEGYIRKQTLSNSERFITEELKELESRILGAGDKIKSIEYDYFCAIRDKVAESADRIREGAALLAEVDFYCSLAAAAYSGGYICPEISAGDELIIKDGRHPVVEQFVSDSYFVPNDTELDCRDNRLALITGPNMAGKSTYMRQVALIVLMAQIGSFVPAKYAKVGIVDKLFTRVGASDDLSRGQSTFMLEMSEVSYILKNATKKSLILYDEIGRGTSTYDGMSIARAVAEYTASKKLGAKTLFATHYHELTALEDELPGIVNYNIAAKKRGENITFLRKIVRGPTDDSYGIDVARLAGVPDSVIRRAREILASLESGDAPRAAKGGYASNISQKERGDNIPLSFEDMAKDDIVNAIENTDINTLTPIEAMNLIFDWKKKLMK